MARFDFGITLTLSIWLGATSAKTALGDNLLAMSGPLTLDSSPAVIDLGDLGTFEINGVITGLGYLQDNSSPQDKHLATDFDNAQVLLQSKGERLQLFVAAGAYSLPALETAYLARLRGHCRTIQGSSR